MRKVEPLTNRNLSRKVGGFEQMIKDTNLELDPVVINSQMQLIYVLN